MGEWQTCAVPGRRISDNLTLLRDLIVYAQSNNLPLAVAGIDIEKAYDRVAHSFLFGVLGQMGFPDKFLVALKKLYTGMTSCVLVNGKVSDPFGVSSGVRQGCPLSPVMFICVMEPLLRHVQRDKIFQGFFTPGGDGVKVKSICYMDDVTFFCSSPADLKGL